MCCYLLCISAGPSLQKYTQSSCNLVSENCRDPARVTIHLNRLFGLFLAHSAPQMFSSRRDVWVYVSELSAYWMPLWALRVTPEAAGGGWTRTNARVSCQYLSMLPLTVGDIISRQLWWCLWNVNDIRNRQHFHGFLFHRSVQSTESSY